MAPQIALRFDNEFAPHIAAKIASLYNAGDLETEVLPREGIGRPTRVWIGGRPLEAMRGYPHRLNVYLTWQDDAVIELVTDDRQQEFARYLESLPHRMGMWQQVRRIDFGSRTQAEVAILISDLDFDA